MKKIVLFALSICVLLSGCGIGSSNAGNDNDQSSFKAAVLEINENSILVEPLEGEDVLRSADRVSVSTTGIDISDDLAEGDIVEIIYSGGIMESYPAQIGSVISINIVTESVEGGELSDRRPMVMIGGELYYDTGKESDLGPRCGTMDGEITSTVGSTEVPTKDNQSNFGEGYGYQYLGEYSIDVYMNDKWIRFEKELNNFNGVSMKVIEASGTSAKLEILNTTDLVVMFGEDYNLQVLQNGKWSSIPYLIDNWGFNSIGYEALKDKPYTWEVDWTVFHGELSPGTYRIVKSVMDFRASGDYTNYHLASEFTITES